MGRICKAIFLIFLATFFLHSVSATPVEDAKDLDAAKYASDDDSTATSVVAVPSDDRTKPDLKERAELALQEPTGIIGENATAFDCDPCDDGCDQFASEADVRVVYGDESVPFLPGEAYRWRISGKRQLSILDFNCGAASSMPDVCQNMCYGVNCRGHATTLTRNSVRNSCSQARRQNTCGSQSPNRCSRLSGYPAGNNCDEYPFASTIQGQQAGTGGRTNAVTRCVPVSENSRQGGLISGIYRNVPQGGQFTVNLNLMGGAGTGYCSSNVAARNCGVLSGSQMDT